MSQPDRGPGARKLPRRPARPASARSERSSREQVDRVRRTAEGARAEPPPASHGLGTLSPTGMDQDPLG